MESSRRCQSSDFTSPNRQCDRERQTNPFAPSSFVGSASRFARIPVVARKNRHMTASQIFACTREKYFRETQKSDRKRYASGVAACASFRMIKLTRKALPWPSCGDRMFSLASVEIAFPRCDANAIERAESSKEQRRKRHCRPARNRSCERKLRNQDEQRPCGKQKSDRDFH